MLKNLILPLLVGLALWFVQDRWRDIPTATYAITNPIEIPNASGNLEFAQEVSILNSGRSVVKDISIKVPRHISTYKLTKHSNQIVEKSFSDATSFELIYPELPQGQKIRLLLRYEGTPIEPDWVSVSHADGNAQPQDKQLPSINYFWVWLAFFAGFISNVALDTRKFRKDWFLRWVDSKKLFQDDKPWYWSSSEWKDLQFNAIENALERYSYDPIEQQLCYVLLNRSKPAQLPEESWSKLQSHATKLLEGVFSQEVTAYSSKDKLIDLLKIKKPEGLPHQNWSKIQGSLNARLEKLLLPEHSKAADLVMILEGNSTFLQEIPSPLAATIRESAQAQYFKYLQELCFESYRDNSLETINSARLDLLTPKQANYLKDLALKLTKLYTMPSKWSIQGLESFLATGKPKWMSENEFSDIHDIVLQAKSLANEQLAVQTKLKTLEATEIEVEHLKNRVTAQLSLIDKVLSDPNSISKLEDYDSTFAPGNRRNLELVASILKPTL